MKTLSAICLLLSFNVVLMADPESNKKPQPEEETALSGEDRTALEIGKAVMAVDRALAFKLPDAPTPEQKAEKDMHTEAMIRAGQTTRLYLWVRSRINTEISTAQSFLRDTNPDEARTRELNARIKYLSRVGYLIDAPR